MKSGAECLEVTEAILGKLASKDNPQTMLAVFRQRWAPAPDARRAARDDVWVALEEVRDPGNLGTIIRTADAVGAEGVILIGQSCDPYAHECVRATMGSIFAVPLVKMTREAFLGWRAGWPGDVVGTHARGRGGFPQGRLSRRRRCWSWAAKGRDCPRRWRRRARGSSRFPWRARSTRSISRSRRR